MAQESPLKNDKILGDLHAELLKELLRRVKSGDAKPADLAVAAKFLRDNNISSTPEASPDLVKLLKELPEFAPND